MVDVGEQDPDFSLMNVDLRKQYLKPTFYFSRHGCFNPR